MKDKIITKVPYGTCFVSELKNYTLPKEHCIIDKGVTGCGYTEWTLTNNLPTVLCSPRKLLLENKCDQHTKDINIYYLNVDKFLDFAEIEETLEVHLRECKKYSLTPKILVTYDSVHYVIDFLQKRKIIDDFFFIVDEFQSIFLDSYFKAEVENDFLEYLQKCKNVVYLSATPMLDKYLVQLDEFKDLQYYQLDWSESGIVEKARIQRILVPGSLSKECGKIIQNYLNGNFPSTLDKKTRKIVESKEAVFYFNNIEEIKRICKKHKLSPLNTRIICSDTEKNRRSLKGIGFKPGKVPLKDEMNPMFMFCTKTVYVGVDFYSKCASSYVFANPNIDSLALDIGLALPQIIGRQRDPDNLFKGNIVVYYKVIKKDMIITEEEFKKRQEEKFKASNALLTGWDDMKNSESRKEFIRVLRANVELNNYSKDFISVSQDTGNPVINKLIVLADQRAWEVCQKDYQDEINVVKALSEIGIQGEKYNQVEITNAENLLEKFKSFTQFTQKMEFYCLTMTDSKINDNTKELFNLSISDPKFERYYLYFGLKGCKAREFREGELKKEWDNEKSQDQLTEEVYKNFKEGDKLTKKEIKERLKKICNNLGLEINPKAEDINNWFETKRYRPNINGKEVAGFELIRRK